ncbi:hypothetical protein B484DRAFT_454767 [Ochromonadaceae sp. CCMP2298]|nr:hypothetical protein B484DRAFT_454767 [Ochromonadaceae sp. CCMP2298]
MSPLLLKKMPRLVVVTMGFILLAAWAGSFGYTLNQLYFQCTESNQCISCAVTLSESDGATCERLAVTNFNVQAGCVSIPMNNDYKTIDNVLESIALVIKDLHGRGLINDDFFASLQRHGEIADVIRGNSLNQMIDPDATNLATFLNANFLGLSDGLSSQNDRLGSKILVSAGLKILFSYISIGCALNSIDTDENPPTETVTDGISYTQFDICGCNVQCPNTLDLVVAGTVDVSMADAVYGFENSNGLGTLKLSLPDKYVQTVDETADPPFLDQQAVVEMQYVSTSSLTLGHCPTSVFTQTPAQLNGQFYECCTEKNNVEKLSEANAFSGLVLTTALIFTTILFYPLSPKMDAETMKEMAMGMAED